MSRRRRYGLVCGAALALWSRIGVADDARFAVDHYEPAERGSAWFANESLDLRGHLRPSLGIVGSWAWRPSTMHDSNGEVVPPVRNLAVLHAGGSMVFGGRLRVAFDLPLEVFADGRTAADATVAAPRNEQGLGDLRIGAECRLFGQQGAAITGAIGTQVWAPSGQQSQWASDGAWRARPRAIVAGSIGIFAYAAQLGILFRRSESLAKAPAIGDAVSFSAAAGVRLGERVTMGPELLGGALFADPLGKSATPLEILVGSHWLIADRVRVGAGVARGLTDGVGAAEWRGLLDAEWSPGHSDEHADAVADAEERPRPSDPTADASPVDADFDGVPDDRDGCRGIPGIATKDPATNGCPPDTDGDGVDDLQDACPTAPGPRTFDPATNGCDLDRDKDGVPNAADACPDDPGTPDSDPARSGCPLAFVRGDRIELLAPVTFGPGLEVSEAPVLHAILDALVKHPEVSRLRIEAHTDGRGDAVANRKVTAARAASIVRWLRDRGVDESRLTSAGVGADRPIDTNETEAGRANNRRVELHIVRP